MKLNEKLQYKISTWINYLAIGGSLIGWLIWLLMILMRKIWNLYDYSYFHCYIQRKKNTSIMKDKHNSRWIWTEIKMNGTIENWVNILRNKMCLIVSQIVFIFVHFNWFAIYKVFVIFFLSIFFYYIVQLFPFFFNFTLYFKHVE